MPTGKNKPGTRPPGRKEKKMDTEISEMQPTCSLKLVIEREVRDDPFGAYIKYNLAEIRKACLRRIGEIQDISSYHADWAEGVIGYLRKNHDDDWKKIIEWYIYAAEDEPILMRAIEFALTLSHKERGLISKLLAGRLRKGSSDTDLYYQIPSLREFFHGLLRNVYWEKWWWRGKTRSGEYSEDVWYGAERALDVAILTGDFSMIDKIEDIISLMGKGIIFPWRFAHWATKGKNIACLELAKEGLEKAKYEAEEESKEELE